MTTTLSHADRLVSTDTVPASEIVYDDRGNNTQLGDLELEFDAADRHVRTVTPRDPLDRIAERTHMAELTGLFRTKDFGEAVSAFMEKRDPQYKGR